MIFHPMRRPRFSASVYRVGSRLHISPVEIIPKDHGRAESFESPQNAQHEGHKFSTVYCGIIMMSVRAFASCSHSRCGEALRTREIFVVVYC